MAGGAETPNIASLPAIARLGTCESERGPDADRHVKLLIQFAVEGSLSALIHTLGLSEETGAADVANRDRHADRNPGLRAASGRDRDNGP
jgi:hypothetical protein